MLALKFLVSLSFTIIYFKKGIKAEENKLSQVISLNYITTTDFR